MRLLTLVVLLAGPVARADPDPWFGEDKALHFGFCGVIALGSYATATAFTETPKARVIYGASIALLAGIGKELWDASGNGHPSWRDLTWDLVGAAVGLAIGWAVDVWVAPIFRRPRAAEVRGGT